MLPSIRSPSQPGTANEETRRKQKNKVEVNMMTKMEEDNSPKEKESFKRATPHEEVECIPFTISEPTKTFRVGKNLDKQHTLKLNELIKEFADVFVWGTEDMGKVDPELAFHRLHVDPIFVPFIQRKRTFSEEKNLTIREEVANLLKVEAIRELQFLSCRECGASKKPNNK
ncbi:hypothetical protein LIER_35174 [Lithospermum erythrorhizon]|uniref:Uncharacterized protein n=1 Tax=Lithospermum erythrorhizon TaxID=34254 RepID=A0AAV3NKV5_LITER